MNVTGNFMFPVIIRYANGMSEAHLTIEIKNSSPVELMDLTMSFLGMAAEFRHYIEKNAPEASAADLKLYVREIKSGSIIADLVAISPQIIQSVPTYAPLILAFAKHLKTGFDFLSGLKKERPEIDNSSIRNLSKILNPIAKDGASQFNIGTLENNVYFNIDSRGALDVQNQAAILLAGEKGANVREKVLLYWWQARADINSRTGDKGIIESIASHPVKVVCADNGVKAQMVAEDENPFKYAYVVDVVVETVNGKAALYNIIRSYEKVEKPI